jgi:hypothetical protein
MDIMSMSKQEMLSWLEKLESSYVCSRLGLRLGQVVLLVGPSCTAKSWVALELMQALGTGLPLFGKHSTVGCSVLYLNRRHDLERTMRRFLRLQIGNPHKGLEQFRKSNITTNLDVECNLESEEDFQSFARLTDGYQVVIVESRIFNNLYDYWDPVYMQKISELAKARNQLFLFVTILYNGLESWVDNADCVLKAHRIQKNQYEQTDQDEFLICSDADDVLPIKYKIVGRDKAVQLVEV